MPGTCPSLPHHGSGRPEHRVRSFFMLGLKHLGTRCLSTGYVLCMGLCPVPSKGKEKGPHHCACRGFVQPPSDKPEWWAAPGTSGLEALGYGGASGGPGVQERVEITAGPYEPEQVLGR